MPVVDSTRTYRGTVTAQRVETAMRDNGLDAAAADLVVDAQPEIGDESLERALSALVANDRAGVLVLDRAGGALVGWLTERDVLLA